MLVMIAGCCACGGDDSSAGESSISTVPAPDAIDEQRRALCAAAVSASVGEGYEVIGVLEGVFPERFPSPRRVFGDVNVLDAPDRLVCALNPVAGALLVVINGDGGFYVEEG